MKNTALDCMRYLKIANVILSVISRTTKPSFRETGCVKTILSSQTKSEDAVILPRLRNAKHLRISNAESNVQGFSSHPLESPHPHNLSLLVVSDSGVPKTSIESHIMRTHTSSPLHRTQRTSGSRGILPQTPSVPTAASL